MHPNEIVVRRVLQAFWNDRDESVMEMVAVPRGGQAQGIDIESRKGMSKKEYVEFARMLTAAFPDLQMTIEESIGDDERVAFRFHLTMTHLGTFLGIPATGRTVRVQGMGFCWFRGTKSTGSISQWDLAGLLQQIGGLELPSMRPKKAATRKPAAASGSRRGGSRNQKRA